MLNLDNLAAILVVIIMILEVVILFKALFLNSLLCLALWLLLEGMNLLIRAIYQRCFEEKGKK